MASANIQAKMAAMARNTFISHVSVSFGCEYYAVQRNLPTGDLSPNCKIANTTTRPHCPLFRFRKSRQPKHLRYTQRLSSMSSLFTPAGTNYVSVLDLAAAAAWYTEKFGLRQRPTKFD